MNRALTHPRRITLTLLLLALLQPVGAAIVGPDNWGYSARDNTQAGGPVFDFIDIRGSGQLLVNGDDIASAPVTLGNPFSLYGQQYRSLVASSNGYLSTDPADDGRDHSNDATLPSTPDRGAGARIYPLHDDLVSAVYHQYFANLLLTGIGATSADVFQWTGRPWSCVHNCIDFSFQALLLGSGDLLFQYLDGPLSDMPSYSVGLQNADASDGLLIGANRLNLLRPQGAWLISAPPSALRNQSPVPLPATLLLIALPLLALPINRSRPIDRPPPPLYLGAGFCRRARLPRPRMGRTAAR